MARSKIYTFREDLETLRAQTVFPRLLFSPPRPGLEARQRFAEWNLMVYFPPMSPRPLPFFFRFFPFFFFSPASLTGGCDGFGSLGGHLFGSSMLNRDLKHCLRGPWEVESLGGLFPFAKPLLRKGDDIIGQIHKGYSFWLVSFKLWLLPYKRNKLLTHRYCRLTWIRNASVYPSKPAFHHCNARYNDNVRTPVYLFIMKPRLQLRLSSFVCGQL